MCTTKLHVDIKYTQNAIAISHFGAKALAEIKYIFRQKLRHTVHPLYIFWKYTPKT